MPEFRPYEDLPSGLNPALQAIVGKRHEVLGLAILPAGEESLKVVWGIAEKEFNDFDWVQYVFSDLEDRVGLRGFICASKVFVVWTWQATDPTQLPKDTWMFKVVFDYGEGYYTEDEPDAQGRTFARARNHFHGLRVIFSCQSSLDNVRSAEPNSQKRRH